jgi:hypothetical protein
LVWLLRLGFGGASVMRVTVAAIGDLPDASITRLG